jgi:hypothetical protein
MESLKYNKHDIPILRIEYVLMFLIFLVVCHLRVDAQLERERVNACPDTKRPGLLSVFKDFKNGDFPGTLNGVLFLQKNGSKEISKFIFHEEEVSLHIEYDPDFVYDVSRKHYLFKRHDIQLHYTTYFLANSFEVIIGKDTVGISKIDGCSCVIINNLEWSYSADKNRELLYLYASADIGLWKRGTEISSYVIKAGSTLCFDIYRKKVASGYRFTGITVQD